LKQIYFSPDEDDGFLIAITGSVQSGVLSILLFFIAGMVILWTVNEKKGMEEKKKTVI
jgi:MFS-type transporter involved in bile tolerance (Atg22 family)